MKRNLIRYRTRPELADENQRLIEAVFEELQHKQLAGVRYAALRGPDAAFYHLVMSEPTSEGSPREGSGSPITQLDAFRTFQSGVRDRCIEGPQSGEVTIVGNYRMIQT